MSMVYTTKPITHTCGHVEEHKFTLKEGDYLRFSPVAENMRLEGEKCTVCKERNR